MLLAIGPCLGPQRRDQAVPGEIVGTAPSVAAAYDGQALGNIVSWGSHTTPVGYTETVTFEMSNDDGTTWVAYVEQTTLTVGEIWAVRKTISATEDEGPGAFSASFTSNFVTVTDIAPIYLGTPPLMSFPQDSGTETGDFAPLFDNLQGAIFEKASGPSAMTINENGTWSLANTGLAVENDVPFTVRVFNSNGEVSVTFSYDIVLAEITASMLPAMSPIYDGQSIADAVTQYAAMIAAGNFTSTVGTVRTQDISISFVGVADAVTAGVENDAVGFAVTVTDDVGTPPVTFTATPETVQYAVTVTENDDREFTIDINPLVPNGENVSINIDGIEYTRTKTEWESDLLALENPEIIEDLGTDPIMSVDPGMWATPTGTLSHAYQWKRNGSNIPGGTSATFDSTSEDGNTITVDVTGDDGTNTPVTVTSAGVSIPGAGGGIKTYSLAASGTHPTQDQLNVTGTIPTGEAAANKYIYLMLTYRIGFNALPAVNIGGTTLSPEVSNVNGGNAQSAIYRVNASAGGDFALTLTNGTGADWRGAAWAAYVVEGDTAGVVRTTNDRDNAGGQIDLSSNVNTDELILACVFSNNEGSGWSATGLAEDLQLGSPLFTAAQAAMFYSHSATSNEIPRPMTIDPNGASSHASGSLVVIG